MLDLLRFVNWEGRVRLSAFSTELSIRRLRKSDVIERRDRVDREIKELMKQSYGR